MDLSRRLFLSSVPVLAAGCASLDPRSKTPTARPDRDGDGVPDGVDDYPTDDRRAVRSFRASGTVTLLPGEFKGAVALTDSPDASGDIVHYEVSVDGEAGIDCLVFRRDAWDAYAAGSRDVDVVGAYSRLDVTATDVTVQLDAGEYLFALDYTELLTDPGPDPVEVRHILEVAEPR
jgi:hypothetical protein